MESQRSYVIAGTGHRARTYIEALTGPYRAVARVVAFCDPNVARAGYYRFAYDLHDVPIAGPGDFSPLLRQRRPDVVLVTSPDHTHDTYICAALAMGIDVITEKPMTIDWEPAVQIPIPAGGQAHGGGDDLMLRDLLRGTADDNLGRAAGVREPKTEATTQAITQPGSPLTSSMSRDLADGRPVEVEPVLADLASRGSAHGVRTPLLDLATMHLRATTTGSAGTR